MFINGIVPKVTNSEVRIAIWDRRLQILLFADDMVLMAENEDGLRDLMTKVREYCTQWQLEVNVKKTKVMVVSKEGKETAEVKYGDDELDSVTEFSYLEVMFT